MHLLAWIASASLTLAANVDAQENPAALFEEGRRLLQAPPTELNAEMALGNIRQAAEAGHPDAIGAMGFLYARGLAVPKDPTVAADWFRRGAEAGSAKAQLNYGTVLLAGEGVPKDEAAAVFWITRAAEAGLPEAQERLGFAYLHGDALPGIAKDTGKAHELLKTAAEAGRASAQNAFGLILGESGDHHTSITWLGRAARQGLPKAQANLGRALLNSAGGADSHLRAEGLMWLLLAEQANEPTARNSLNLLMPACSGSEIESARRMAEAFRPVAGSGL